MKESILSIIFIILSSLNIYRILLRDGLGAIQYINLVASLALIIICIFHIVEVMRLHKLKKELKALKGKRYETNS